MIQYLIMDVDGTLTDGKVYMGSDGELMKAFSIKDGYAIKIQLKDANIIPIVITARESQIVKNRCNELEISRLFQGKTDKLTVLKNIVGEDKFNKCAYFGDDCIDLECMQAIKNAGGIIGCPADAIQEIKLISNYVCENVAGDGALREFVEWIINPVEDREEIEKRVEEALYFLQSLKIKYEDIGKKIEVSNDFFYIVQSYYTNGDRSSPFESHKKYIDIQIICRGEENMEISDVSRMKIEKKYDENKDIALWKPIDRVTKVGLKEDSYVILYPESAHRVCSVTSESVNVVKIVGKIRV